MPCIFSVSSLYIIPYNTPSFLSLHYIMSNIVTTDAPNKQANITSKQEIRQVATQKGKRKSMYEFPFVLIFSFLFYIYYFNFCLFLHVLPCIALSVIYLFIYLSSLEATTCPVSFVLDNFRSTSSTITLPSTTPIATDVVVVDRGASDAATIVATRTPDSSAACAVPPAG